MGLGSSLIVRVKTGDCSKAGTHANIRVRLHDDKSNSSDPIVLNNCFKYDFRTGSLDIFKVPRGKVARLGENANITHIELWRDDAGLNSDWLVDIITIENRSNHLSFVFPIFRWIEANYHYHIKHLGTSLPQFDEYPEQRKMELDRRRKKYEYEQKLEGGPVQIKTLPDEEQFSFSYKWDLTASQIKLFATSDAKKNIKPGEFSSLQEIEKIYDNVFPKPKNLNGWKSDVFFAYQRLASHNPTIIKQATEIPDKFPVTDDILGRLLDGFSLSEALARRRLFICDYELMEGIPTKENFTVGLAFMYKICHPIGLFFVNKDQQLLPVAIQLFQKPGPTNPIFTPEDPELLWCLVKMWFNNADAAYHQAITHLGLTHLLMESITVVTHRTLSRSHPVFKLLAPHFLYVIAINSMALKFLLPPGAWIDNNMNAGSHGMIELTRRGLDMWHMNVHGILPKDLKNRGVDDVYVLPKYHYRDDAQDTYEAIKKYVTSYVNNYYGSSEDVCQDNEIQNWVQEFVAERCVEGAGLKGIPGNGELTSTDPLIQILTSIIFTCSVSHAASNFPQYDQYCYPPNYPAMMRGSPPTSKDMAVTEKTILKTIATRQQTLETMSITKLLSTKGTKSLGNFEVEYVFDPEVTVFLNEFKEDLKEISAKIAKRNETRKYVYDYLDPKEIPNSISI